jgi:hypothetical protein
MCEVLGLCGHARDLGRSGDGGVSSGLASSDGAMVHGKPHYFHVQ